MKIGLLVSENGLYSHRRFKEAAEARGHDLKIINLTECFINITADNPTIFYRNGEKIDNFDAIIPRIKPSLTFFGTAILRQYELLGTYPLNNSLAVIRARDKLRSLQILANHKIPMPVTALAHSPLDTQNVIKSVGGAPVIIKLVEGTHGSGVVLAETKSGANSVISAFKQLNADILVQEFIKESSGTDIRCFVLGKKVITSMQRVANDGEFRANYHLGADIMPVEITSEEREMVIKATKALGLNMAGVDILRSNRGSLVLEINASPGLEGIEKVSKIDIAGKIIEYIEKHAKPYKIASNA